MKTIISKAAVLVFFALLLNVSFANAGTNPEHLEPKSSFNSFFENTAVDFRVEVSDLTESLAMISYNESNEYFSMKTIQEVSFIQILNSKGELEFQLPIKNSLVHLSLRDFVEGDYYVNILFEGESEYLTTMLTKK